MLSPLGVMTPRCTETLSLHTVVTSVTTLNTIAMLVLVLVSPLLLAALATASTLHVVDIQPEPTAVRMAVLACQGLINRQVPRDRSSPLTAFMEVTIATGGE